MPGMSDPAIWSTAIALVALVLSQLPPIHDLMKRRALRIIAPQFFPLWHNLGNVNLYAFLGLYNDGGRTITIGKIDCLMLDDSGTSYRLPAQSYVSRQPPPSSEQSPAEFFMEWLVLKPGQHWAETIHFVKPWSVQDEEAVADVIGKIRNDINAKLASRPPDQKGLVEANANAVEEAKDFFEKRFKLTKGNYKLIVAALSEKNEVIGLRGFSFTLFESQIRALRAATDDYKIGAGIYFPNTDPSKQVFIRLRPMAEEETRKTYSKPEDT
jgi:hypothetical protein